MALNAARRLVDMEGHVDAAAVTDLHWGLHMGIRALEELDDFEPGMKGSRKRTRNLPKPPGWKVRRLQRALEEVQDAADDVEVFRSIEHVGFTRRTTRAEARAHAERVMTWVERSLLEKPLEGVSRKGKRTMHRLCDEPFSSLREALADLDATDGGDTPLRDVVEAIRERIESSMLAMDELAQQHVHAEDRVDDAKEILDVLADNLKKLREQRR